MSACKTLLRKFTPAFIHVADIDRDVGRCKIGLALSCATQVRRHYKKTEARSRVVFIVFMVEEKGVDVV
jgi:hypothetical protein